MPTNLLEVYLTVTGSEVEMWTTMHVNLIQILFVLSCA